MDNKKFIKENQIPLNYEVKVNKDTKGNPVPKITQVFRLRKGAIPDVNVNTNTTILTSAINQIEKSFVSAFKKVNEKEAQNAGRDSRLVTKPTGGRYSRFARLGYNERSEFINGQIKLLMNQLKVKNIIDLAKNFRKDKRISGVIYPSTHLEAGMWLKRFGLTPREIIIYCFERMFATQEYRTKHYSRNLDNYLDDITKINVQQPNWVLISQWATHLATNAIQREVNWKKRKPKYTLKQFYMSDFYKNWCETYKIERYKKYSSFCNFIKQSILDFRKFCRRNFIDIPVVLKQRRPNKYKFSRLIKTSGSL